MKPLITFLFIITSTFLSLQVVSADKPTQHLDVADMSSMEEAKTVFLETTSVLQSKNILDEKELNEIHITTYSLEKAIAYFVENMSGDQKIEAKKMADLVELIHLSSETDRADQARIYLEDYAKRALIFAKKL